MGQTCSSAACASPTEPEIEELSRNDSPDPVMYDLMRQSIRATTVPDVSSSTTTSTPMKQNAKRKPPGQHHLLYNKHASKAETPVHNFPKPSGTATTSSRSTSSNNNSSSPSNKENTDPLLPSWLPPGKIVDCPTRLLIRRRSMRVMEEGGGTHIYAIRYPEDTPDRLIAEQAAPRPESARPVEQCPRNHKATTNISGSRSSSSSNGGVDGNKTMTGATSASTKSNKDNQGTVLAATTKNSGATTTTTTTVAAPAENVDFFTPEALANAPKSSVSDWVTVSEEHNVYIADVGLTDAQCDYIVSITEQVCKGQYAAYTYAKQTLGCREFPVLAQSCVPPVHTVISEISQRLVRGSMPALQLDDREPHIVKYDVTKKERQKLDMHTDKSEWTFLIALSHGCGVDYEGGGTYFECLDATIHIQRGHCLIFPGKLRHCGQKISSGLRFLLVGFLVDKSSRANAKESSTTSTQRSLVPHYPLFVVPPGDDLEEEEELDHERMHDGDKKNKVSTTDAAAVQNTTTNTTAPYH